MEWVSENSGMQSGQTMMNTLLFLVDENSNPQQEFGILIFFATTQTELLQNSDKSLRNLNQLKLNA